MLSHVVRHARRRSRGQALVEFGLVLPLFIMVLVGIVTLGMGIYFQQQVTNVAREAARFAAIHSATARCPVVSNREPSLTQRPRTYYRCTPPETRWPAMTAYARSHLFGLRPSVVQLSACWSGYWTKDGAGTYTAWDALPFDLGTGTPNDFRTCSVASNDPVDGSINVDPSTSLRIDPATGKPMLDGLGNTNHRDVACTSPMPTTGINNDMASALSASNGGSANEVTVFACYEWHPPMAGFLLIPSTVTLRAVVVETLQYQQ